MLILDLYCMVYFLKQNLSVVLPKQIYMRITEKPTTVLDSLLFVKAPGPYWCPSIPSLMTCHVMLSLGNKNNVHSPQIENQPTKNRYYWSSTWRTNEFYFGYRNIGEGLLIEQKPLRGSCNVLLKAHISLYDSSWKLETWNTLHSLQWAQQVGNDILSK